MDSEIEKLAKEIVDIAYTIHVELGPGLFESVYEEVFCIELQKRNINFKRQHPIDIFYKEHRIERAFKCDILVDDSIIIELKSVAEIQKINQKQLLNYLKLTGLPLGFLINFNELLIKNGIQRIAN
jgi:GxxExxY protein